MKFLAKTVVVVGVIYGAFDMFTWGPLTQRVAPMLTAERRRRDG